MPCQGMNYHRDVLFFAIFMQVVHNNNNNNSKTDLEKSTIALDSDYIDSERRGSNGTLASLSLRLFDHNIFRYIQVGNTTIYRH
jgi:hypothetical protein